MTPMMTQELVTTQASTEELRDAQVNAGAWTALLAAMVSLAALQGSVGALAALSAAGFFTAIAGGIHRGWAWSAAIGSAVLAGGALGFAGGLVPVIAAARIPVVLLAGAGALCLAGAYLTLSEKPR